MTITLEKPNAPAPETQDPKTAWIIRRDLPGFTGEVHLWETSDGRYFVTSYVYIGIFGGVWETLCFPANKDGEVVDWIETAGLRKREPAHHEVIEMTGYTPIEKGSE